MRVAFRLATAGLLVCLLSPQPVAAGGGVGEDPYAIGEKLRAKKHYRTALTYYRQALDLNDTRAHYGMGLAYEGLGKDADALHEYQLFVALGLQNPLHHDAVRRAAAIEERLKKGKKQAAGPLEQGQSLFRKGKYREAEKALLRAVAEDPKNPEAHFYLGEVYYRLKAYEKATAEYRKAKGSY